MNEQYHVFLSYSRKDLEIMQRVAYTLRDADLRVWVDEELTPGTASWMDSIEQVIESTNCVVVLLSPDAKKSEWVKRELEYARIQGTRIFPILARGEERSAIPLSLMGTHFADVRETYAQGMRNLTRAINELIGRSSALKIPPSELFTRKQIVIQKSEQRLSLNEAEIISILVVDDILEARTNIGNLLKFEPDFKVIGEAANGREAVEMVKRFQPDIVMMDINMPDMDGITATRLIFNAFTSVAVIMMSVQNDKDYLRKAMLAGARAFLPKPIDMDELYNTIRQVHRANKLQP